MPRDRFTWHLCNRVSREGPMLLIYSVVTVVYSKTLDDIDDIYFIYAKVNCNLNVDPSWVPSRGLVV